MTRSCVYQKFAMAFVGHANVSEANTLHLTILNSLYRIITYYVLAVEIFGHFGIIDIVLG